MRQFKCEKEKEEFVESWRKQLEERKKKEEEIRKRKEEEDEHVRRSLYACIPIV